MDPSHPVRRPAAITTGPDGNLWFIQPHANQVARITPTGTITEFPLPPGTGSFDIVTGPDGNLWIASWPNAIVRFTVTGVGTTFPIPTPGGGPTDIAAGPDGGIWFNENVADQIGRFDPFAQAHAENVPALSTALMIALAVMLALGGVLVLTRQAS